ncbi:MAG: hypothetical protein GWO16_04605, partial [Gammaproteobacteria bacterium]|nr:hypothetical protein [Gammaproteobacteria bacterium]NIR97376.1 hypothetical protein [Gammaproteobacteria bacterium]NIT63033.1 hypothetical protein [Gammaproteobacteria bacterium]NIV19985.1 hypothetical protein [Gammaproteobacteria bacterium]NIY31613.1 hypothetical protein [Gammaproteobacteria bacterium]
FRKGAFSLLWEDGAVSVLQLKFQPEFSADGRRTITPIAEVPARKVLAANGAAPGLAVARHTEDDGLT